MKRYMMFFLTLLSTLIMSAQHIRVTAPKHVAVGEEFQIEYTIYTQDVRRFQLGKLSAGLEKVFGPATSSQSNFQFIDGHASSSSSVSFTYVFIATKRGGLSIGPAKIFVNGQDLASTPVKITASNIANNSHASNSGSYYDTRERSRLSNSKIGPNDLFIKVRANKSTVYEQEPVLLTYKVYTTKNLRQLVGKMPDLSGFHVQEIDLPQQKTFHKERVGKRIYNCVTWSEYVMYPQVTGTLRVPPLTFHGIIQVNDAFNPFEAFGIDGGSTSIKKDVVAPGFSIRVLPLPTRPTEFSGGVGHFNLSAQLNKKEVRVGDPFTIRVVVSGSGNLKLIKQPIIKLPNGFEAYDVKVTDKTQLTTKGNEGNMIYDQVVVPHKEGVFSIPSAKFCYYDLLQRKFITLQTTPIDIRVLKGNGSVSDAMEVNLPKEDILPLKLGNSSLSVVDNSFFGSVAYFLTLGFLLAACGILSFCFRRRFAHHVDMVLKRGKNANRTAAIRLHNANSFMLKGNNLDFYDEILQALWGYASDKLSLPIEQLSRENIIEQLSKIGVSNEIAEKFIIAIDECEYERYAPGDEKGNMKKTFDSAMQAIAGIEESIKKAAPSISKSLIFVVLLFVFSIFSLHISAQSKREVDQMYQKGNYKQAVKGYENLLKEKESAALFYNLGNAYYRLDDIPHAVLAYERAQRLAPSNDDIRFNLQLAQSKTIDNLTPEPEMFFVTWYKSFVSIVSIDVWAYLSLICLLICLLGLILYLFIESDIVRRILRMVLPLFFICFLLGTTLAIQQSLFLNSHDRGVIMSSSAVARKTPDQNSAEVFILHEGSKVKITDDSMGKWTEIELNDGRRGWIQSSRIEAI